MAKPNQQQIEAAFAPHLTPSELLQTSAYGVKQPHIALITLLCLLGVLPGLLAIAFMTKHYRIGLTRHRVIVLQTKSMNNLETKHVLAFELNSMQTAMVKTSQNSIFTNIKIEDGDTRFVAKFHRAYTKTNRADSWTIAQKLAGTQDA